MKSIFVIASSSEEAQMLMWRCMVNAEGYGWQSREDAEAVLADEDIPERFRRGLGIAEIERGGKISFTTPAKLVDSPFTVSYEEGFLWTKSEVEADEQGSAVSCCDERAPEH